MNPEITSINIQYQDNTVKGVQVYYNGYDEEQTMGIGGYIHLTAEEYSGNEALDVLVMLVKERVVNKLTVKDQEVTSPLPAE